MHDIIIIGAGPAGISAGVYCARKMMDTLVISKDVGGQATWSWEVENYLGYQLISGVELVEHFREHLENFSVELVEGSSVSSLTRDEEVFSSVTENGEGYESRAVIVASGKLPRELDVPGEREFRGRGVAYCATCDAPLFRGKKVVVVGGGNSAIDAALQLSKIAEKTTMTTIEDQLGGDEIRREQCLESANVEVLTSTEVTAIHGETFVKSIDIIRKGKEQTLEAEGKLDVKGGRGTYSLEETRFNGVAVPVWLVSSILSYLAKSQLPNVDIAEPFVLPFGITDVRLTADRAVLLR